MPKTIETGTIAAPGTKASAIITPAVNTERELAITKAPAKEAESVTKTVAEVKLVQ